MDGGSKFLINEYRLEMMFDKEGVGTINLLSESLYVVNIIKMMYRF